MNDFQVYYFLIVNTNSSSLTLSSCYRTIYSLKEIVNSISFFIFYRNFHIRIDRLENILKFHKELEDPFYL